ncbi:hypothetical protein [Verticiella sediminum]|uniref:hypothetical protein n=1 Tax=Verticiella sediminum TaxID=1247510 RepID=UPI001478E94C|nr:hypothetical protein [Verticiella sediminum]
MKARWNILPALLLALAAPGWAEATAISKKQIQGWYESDLSQCADREGEQRQQCEQKARATRDMMMERIDESQAAEDRKESQDDKPAKRD